MAVDINFLGQFDTSGDPNYYSQRWKSGKRTFNLYFTGRRVKAEGWDKMLLHITGLEVQNNFNSNLNTNPMELPL